MHAKCRACTLRHEFIIYETFNVCFSSRVCNYSAFTLEHNSCNYWICFLQHTSFRNWGCNLDHMSCYYWPHILQWVLATNTKTTDCSTFPTTTVAILWSLLVSNTDLSLWSIFFLTLLSLSSRKQARHCQMSILEQSCQNNSMQSGAANCPLLSQIFTVYLL